jgi:hypothetical protein
VQLVSFLYLGWYAFGRPCDIPSAVLAQFQQQWCQPFEVERQDMPGKSNSHQLWREFPKVQTRHQWGTPSENNLRCTSQFLSFQIFTDSVKHEIFLSSFPLRHLFDYGCWIKIISWPNLRDNPTIILERLMISGWGSKIDPQSRGFTFQLQQPICLYSGKRFMFRVRYELNSFLHVTYKKLIPHITQRKLFMLDPLLMNHGSYIDISPVSLVVQKVKLLWNVRHFISI